MTLVCALGSSFAAGPGIDPPDDVAAGRSARNYPHLLAERIGAELVDLTVSGATTANLLDTPQTVDDGFVFAPQVDGIPGDADLVTITAGGNDLGLVGRMLYVGFSRLMPGAEFVREHAAEFGDEIPDVGEGEVERVAAELVRVVQAVRARAPAVRIMLVDYLTIISAGGPPPAPYSAEERDRLLLLQDAVRRVFSVAADRAGVELVRASALSEEHALGATEPWVQPLTGAGPLHPTAAGMSVVADAIASRLRG